MLKKYLFSCEYASKCLLLTTSCTCHRNRVAVAMPNFEELLKDTEAQVFSSASFDWRKTKNYPVHYSELVRLAVLFK